jgi:hypothetical protein
MASQRFHDRHCERAGQAEVAIWQLIAQFQQQAAQVEQPQRALHEAQARLADVNTTLAAQRQDAQRSLEGDRAARC